MPCIGVSAYDAFPYETSNFPYVHRRTLDKSFEVPTQELDQASEAQRQRLDQATPRSRLDCRSLLVVAIERNVELDMAAQLLELPTVSLQRLHPGVAESEATVAGRDKDHEGAATPHTRRGRRRSVSHQYSPA